VARYNVRLKAIVVREYEAIASRAERRRILAQIASLEREPRPATAGVLPEQALHLRIRLGRYRLLYEICDQSREVTVYRIVDRRPDLSAG
jgi:mRNA interferase RelE/StbE